jgi:hypothetical protein
MHFAYNIGLLSVSKHKQQSKMVDGLFLALMIYDLCEALVLEFLDNEQN